TENDIISLTAAGTGGLEAAVVNFLSPGDKVLAVSIGVFGERFAKIASTYGAVVTKLRFADGEAADPAKVDAALEADPSIRTVLITHNETSTGTTNYLPAFAPIFKKHGVLSLVDAVSSLSAIDLKVDELGLDVVVTGSQKGWMVPPGLAFVSVSPRAWERSETATMPRFYFDMREAKKILAKGQTPWTPAVSVFYGLDVALDMMLKEGRENIFARHQRCADIAREGVKELGLKILPNECFASNTVTAVWAPEGIDVGQLRKTLREHGVVVAGGQGALDGKIFRIGHLGWVHEEDMRAAIAALRLSLDKLGYRAPAAAV
ncbi:MAG: alanine--glyoxylate aminotransferase family protein, partial [Dehalococcoidia bacterium]|nr:alanine--glyoxylate aminotransferase family protein [Dehalococcoidia bacterium]